MRAKSYLTPNPTFSTKSAAQYARLTFKGKSGAMKWATLATAFVIGLVAGIVITSQSASNSDSDRARVSNGEIRRGVD